MMMNKVIQDQLEDNMFQLRRRWFPLVTWRGFTPSAAGAKDRAHDH